MCSSGLSPENFSHVHDEFCYDENGKLICPLPEYQHIHTDECYDENGVQICEISYHQHTEECFRILGENDSALVLECGMEYHIHEDSCYLMVSSVSTDEEQEGFEEAYEPEAEMYEPEAVSEIAYDVAEQSIDVDAAQAFEIKPEHIESITLYYEEGEGENAIKHIVHEGMENIPANSNISIEVKYKDIPKSEIESHNNKIVYKGLPKWLNPNETANVKEEKENENGDKIYTDVGVLAVANGNAVLTFDQSYLDRQVGSEVTIKGIFNVGGSANWRKIDNPSNPDKIPFLNLSFKFEDDLPEKYGDFEVYKSSAKELVEVRGSDGKITNTYLKYELKIKSLEKNIAIPDICITDTLSTENNNPKINEVIKGNGYVGVDTTEETLAGSDKNDYTPYEEDLNSNIHGTVVLEDGSMKWKIANLQPNEERTLVYYVELNEKYVGSGSAGTLHNTAQPKSKEYDRAKVSDKFTPKADVDISKTEGNIDVDSFGNGTIDYTIVVTASADNSYTITDASIKDSFRDGMANYVDKTNSISVTIKSGNTQHIQNIAVGTDGFNIPIPELKSGERMEVTYSVPVKDIFASNNGDVSFSNHASFVGDETSGKLQNGYTFKGSGATTTIRHNQWARKLNGLPVNTETSIYFSGNDVYNYDGTKQNDNTSFTVPEKAQEYIVIVNEDGMWNMSNTSFKDTFHDTRIAYRGYLKIEEFDQTSEIPENNTFSNNDVLSILNGQQSETIWIDIDGRHNFDIVPTKYGLTNGNKVYRLTYYASVDPNQTNIKNIVVANSFTVEGTIGIVGGTIYLNGVRTVVSTTLTGSANYDFEKESLFYEKEYYTSGHGEIYWVIRANGTLPKNLHIQDKPDNNSISSNSLIGVYYGDKDYDFSKITSYEELEKVISDDMELIESGTSQYFYNLESINSLDDLDGRDYAIFSHGASNSGYLTGFKDGDKLKGESLSTRVTFGNSVITTDEVRMWRFERAEGETDKFYIYYTDSLGNHYMHIGNNTATVSDEQGNPLTVSIDNNQVKIANPDDTSREPLGEALNWNGNNGTNIVYAGWKNKDNDANNWHYLGTPDNNTKYDYKPQKITDVNDLDGQQFAIITQGVRYSGLLIGEKSGNDALTAQMYTPHFTDNPPDDIMLTSPLKTWTFQKINGTDNDFYVYYVDENNQAQYLTLGNKKATTDTTPYIIQISCDNGRIKLKDTANDGHTLNWYGGDNSGDLKYSSWKDQNASNDLHYVATEEIISQDSSSDYTYNWSAGDHEGNIKIIKNTQIPQDKSMYIILRTQPNRELSGYDSITFNNEVGIMDDTSGQFDMLSRAPYIYNPDYPVRKEGMVAAYYDGSKWTRCSFQPSNDRDTDSEFKHYFENDFINSQSPGLYVEWLINVNWNGTLEGDVVLTDYLNHKMEPVSVRQFYTPGHKPTYFDLTKNELENYSDWEKITTQSNTSNYPDVPFYYNETTGELKIGIGNLHTANKTNNEVVNLQLICRVTDPNVLFSGDVSTLTNTAKVSTKNGTVIGSHTEKHKINQVYSIKKIGAGAADDDNNRHTTNQMEYTIEINPLAEDLAYNSDNLPVLIDEMSNNMSITGSINVYAKDNNDDSETLLDNINYSVPDINDTTTQIRISDLPDETHLIIKYKTMVNVMPDKTASISNIAYWEGYKQPTAPQCSENFVYHLGGIVSSKSTPIIFINKLDLYNNKLALSDAKFEVRKVNENGTIDNTVLKTATTDLDGRIIFADSNNNPLSCNIVYQIKEVKAPINYVLDDTPKYFMVINNQHDYIINDNHQMSINGQMTDVIISNISNNTPDLEVMFYNKKACVKVDKEFLNESGESADCFYGTYNFGLYYENPIDYNKKPVQILSITYSKKGVSYALDGQKTTEPEFTKANVGGENFIYELDEQNQPIGNGKSAYLNGYSFDVEYSDNSVFVTENGATIKVTNKHHPIYLPMTGGIGLHKYYSIAFCVLMMLSALAVITVRVQKKHN